MLTEHIASQIYANFEFTPTFGQKNVIEKLSSWICDHSHETIFIMNGYAGTGKTTVIAALVAALCGMKIKPILLAPTGRAAKVMSRYSNIPAHTIHKKIYRQKDASDPDSGYGLDFNREQDACFIVDEASMISDRSGERAFFGTGNLLDDLVDFVRRGKRCRLMIVGDNAQLPPVGHDDSPALDPRRMSIYGDVIYTSLDEVVRQQVDSGVLFNATLVRCMFESGIYEPPLFELGFPDVASLEGGELIEKLEECYSRYGRDETIVITRSNKRAGRFNEAIRRHILCAEEQIESGDMLMIVKNNYYYNDKDEEAGEVSGGLSGGAAGGMDFIANGDIARLRRLRRTEDLYGFRFVNAVLQFPDYDDREVEAKLLLDTLFSDSPNLSREDSARLFEAVSEDYSHIMPKKKRMKEILENPYLNALQVKFAYAVTCHKAQGGQWSAVFVDRMLFGDEPMSRDLMRWLYTALTRATERLYFVNFDERFFDVSKQEGTSDTRG